MNSRTLNIYILCIHCNMTKLNFRTFTLGTGASVVVDSVVVVVAVVVVSWPKHRESLLHIMIRLVAANARIALLSYLKTFESNGCILALRVLF